MRNTRGAPKEKQGTGIDRMDREVKVGSSKAIGYFCGNHAMGA